jgi:CubicO group peptidase (beta-lactamase class C family)
MSSAELASLIDPLVTRQLAERRMAAAVVIAVHGGMVVHTRGYGVADVAVGRPMSTATPVRLASISKMFTAAAVLQLVERRVVSLDADARTYLELPALPPDEPPLTIRHLLTHRGGFEYRTSGILSLHGPRAPLPQYLASHWPPFYAGRSPIPRLLP